MKFHFTLVVVGCLLTGSIEGLPISFIQTQLSQYIFGVGSNKNQQSDNYQSCRRVNAPGVGFEFTAKYATASLKYKNGLVVDIAKIDGDADYENTMLQLLKGNPELGYGKPPFANPIHQIKYNYGLALRKSRKLFGLPSTREIGILASTLSALKTEVESYLNHSINGALLAIPSLPYLEDGDLEEAFSHALLVKLGSPDYEPQHLNSFNAAYAGMGYGLCGDWEHKDRCQDELNGMESNQTMMISFDRDSLRMSHSMMSSALQSIPVQLYSDFTLSSETTDSEEYWESVVWTIKQNMKTVPSMAGEEKVRTLVVTGEFAEKKKFLDSLWEALNNLQDDGLLNGRASDIYSQIQVPGFNALYVGARGAAELALRWVGEAEECFEIVDDSEDMDEDNLLNGDLGATESTDIANQAPKPSDSVEGMRKVGSVTVGSGGHSVNICVAAGASIAYGGGVTILSDDSMVAWGVDPNIIKKGIKDVQQIAGDGAWEIQAGIGDLDPIYTAIFF